MLHSGYPLSGGEAVAGTLENAIDVENDDELALEPMNAGRDPRPAPVEIDGIGLAARAGQLHDLADLVDDEAKALALDLGADGHGRLVARVRRQAEAAAH